MKKIGILMFLQATASFSATAFKLGEKSSKELYDKIKTKEQPTDQIIVDGDVVGKKLEKVTIECVRTKTNGVETPKKTDVVVCEIKS